MNNYFTKENVLIFQAGENPNGIFLTKESISDLNMFKNVLIISKIIDDNTRLKYNKDGLYLEHEEKVIGFILKATNVKFPYVYGDVIFASEEYLHLTKMKNYDIVLSDKDLKTELQDGVRIINSFKLSSVELE